MSSVLETMYHHGSLEVIKLPMEERLEFVKFAVPVNIKSCAKTDIDKLVSSMIKAFSDEFGYIPRILEESTNVKYLFQYVLEESIKGVQPEKIMSYLPEGIDRLIIRANEEKQNGQVG